MPVVRGRRQPTSVQVCHAMYGRSQNTSDEESLLIPDAAGWVGLPLEQMRGEKRESAELQAQNSSNNFTRLGCRILSLRSRQVQPRAPLTPFASRIPP